MKKRLIKSALALYFLHSATSFASVNPPESKSEKQILEVGLINQGRYPYFVNSPRQASNRGIYIDLLNQVGKMTNIEFKYKFLPQPRIRHLMKYQKLDVEPGIDMGWRTEERETENSVYTLPFYESEEVIVYRKTSLSFIPTKELDFEALSSCSMSGFHDMDIALKDVDITAESVSLTMMELGRCDYTLMPKVVLNAKGKLSDHLDITSTIKTYDLRIRLAKKHEHLVPKINQAISTLISDGYIDKLFASYIQEGEEYDSI